MLAWNSAICLPRPSVLGLKACATPPGWFLSFFFFLLLSGQPVDNMKQVGLERAGSLPLLPLRCLRFGWLSGFSYSFLVWAFAQTGSLPTGLGNGETSLSQALGAPARLLPCLCSLDLTQASSFFLPAACALQIPPFCWRDP